MKLIKHIRSILLFMIALIIVLQMELIPAKYVPDVLKDVNDAVSAIFERLGDYFESEKEDAGDEVKEIVIDEIENLVD